MRDWGPEAKELTLPISERTGRFPERYKEREREEVLVITGRGWREKGEGGGRAERVIFSEG